MAVSGNGWPVSADPDDLGLVPFVVAGVDFGLVRGGKTHELLHYVATEVHNRVEKASKVLGCWAWNYRENVNSPGTWSNHASGTAIDYNASRHANGDPTANNWTAAQIAEIHAILAEVNGAVRWGGDYNSTPDAMHFEIDVPPGELDAVVPTIEETGLADIPEYGPTLNLGTPATVPFNLAPLLTEVSVSFPTPAVYASSAHWRYIPSTSGRISIDAVRSHYIDPEVGANSGVGPPVTLEIFELRVQAGVYSLGPSLGSSSSYSGNSDPVEPNSRAQGHLLVNVEAGKTYIIRTTAAATFPWIRTVVRIGKFPPQPQWIQPPDKTYTFSRPGSTTAPSVHTFKDGSTVSAQVSTLGATPLGHGVVSGPGPSFYGHWDCYRSFDGPEPATIPEAIQCLWSHTRKHHLGGFFYWSPGNGVEWLGGPGTCPVVAPGDHSEQNFFSDTPVGTRYTDDSGDFFPSMHMDAYGSSVSFSPWAIVNICTHNGEFITGPFKAGNWYAEQQLVSYLPTLLPNGEFIEWESDDCELLNVQVAPAEGATPNAPVTVKWYVGHWFTEAQETGWGPRGGEWYGNTYGPETWVGEVDHMFDYIGGTGSFKYLPDIYWKKEHWPELQSKVGVRFTAIPSSLLSDTVPPELGMLGPDMSSQAIRTYQFMAIKATVRPSRYRVIRQPRMPDITPKGLGIIALNVDDQGRVLY